MLRVTKLTVGRGKREKPPGKDAYYEVEMGVKGEGELVEAKAKARDILDGWLREPDHSSAGLDPDRLNGLPWRSFNRKGEPAQRDEAGWMFTDTKGAGDLVEALKASKKGRLRLKIFEYSFSGNESQFLNRRPLRSRARKSAPSRERAG